MDNYGFEQERSVSGRLLGFILTKADAMSPALKMTEKLLTTLLKSNYGKQLTLIG
jgi:DNA (cytosine-5)-methyltransferase 1